MKTRPYNFGAGPATLPESILLEAQAELLSWQGSGVSILETGHRTPEFEQLMHDAEEDLRQLLAIPDNYHVLFLSGAARTQFAMVPMNLVRPGQQAAFLISGVWSGFAYEEASRLTSAYCLVPRPLYPVVPAQAGIHSWISIDASEEMDPRLRGDDKYLRGDDNNRFLQDTALGNLPALEFTQAPEFQQKLIRKNTAYVHYTPNETINGVRFSQTPQTGSVPLVADMTSCLLSEPIKITDFGLIFAGAQKNIAPAGLTVVIIRSDLLDRPSNPLLPTMMDYRTHATHHSLYATPPMFNCYFAAKMFKWIKAAGGVDALYEKNCAKAEKLYNYIDSSAFYTCSIEKESRSLMNVCFSLPKKTMEADFLNRATMRGLYALKGHRLVGGLRASLYNAMPMAGVDALIAFMQEFQNEIY